MNNEKRESLIDAMLEVPFIRDFDWLGTGSSWPSDEFIRREVGELVDAYEAATADIRKGSEWEYGTGIPAEDGGYWDDDPYDSLEEAREHAAACDLGCVVLRRRGPDEKWELAKEAGQ